MDAWRLTELPLNVDLETKKVLKALPSAHAALAELKGIASTIPDQGILIDTHGLQEAKDSSAIENIITTHDELFSSDELTRQFVSSAAKEVFNYAASLKYGFQLVQKYGLLTANNIIDIFIIPNYS